MLTLAKGCLPKPGLGARVNWGHPLTLALRGCWLLNEGSGGVTRNLCDDAVATFYGGEPQWRGGPGGACVENTASPDRAVNTGYKTLFPPTFSMFVAVSFGVSQGCGVMSRRVGSAGGFEQTDIGITDNATSYSAATAFMFNDYNPSAGGARSVVSPTGYNDDKPHGLLLVRRPDTLIGYVDGKKLGEYVGSAASNPTRTTDPIFLGALGEGDGPFTSYDFLGRIYCAMYWEREIRADEVEELWANPFGWVEQPDDTIWLDLAAGGTTLTLNVSDTITLGESRTHTFGKPLVEALTLAETLAKTAGKPLVDTVTLADAKAMLSGLGKAETLAISDTLAKLAGKPLVDTLSLSDQVNAFLILILALSETLNLGDALAKQAGLGKTDSLGVSDQAAKMLAKQFADALGLADLSDAQIVVLTSLASIILSRRGVPAKSSFTIAPAESQFSVQ